MVLKLAGKSDPDGALCMDNYTKLDIALLLRYGQTQPILLLVSIFAVTLANSEDSNFYIAVFDSAGSHPEH